MFWTGAWCVFYFVMLCIQLLIATWRVEGEGTTKICVCGGDIWLIAHFETWLGQRARAIPWPSHVPMRMTSCHK